jgi:hypothetical protein
MHAPPPRKPVLTAEHYRALALLASSRVGYPEALFLAHGFTAKLIEALVAAALVVVDSQSIRAGGRVMVAQRLRITGAGRQALDAPSRRDLI